ncbi:T-complex protein 1 subunit theta [Astathelohania contejeani]|uniref:T-complex protein 1 subunit theta n=1 Tax=Astathelohania contejeani TaxID=164912 RepID=A0ABQ7I1L4_9MICR|nr:T-complex protein 1 subunit theta [Thelohania contejeani]
MDFSKTNLSSVISPQTTHQTSKIQITLARLLETTNFLESCFGKNGHSKLILDNYGQLSVTSQVPTILANIKPNHPLVTLLIESVKKMESRGDGAAFMTIFAGELMKQVRVLVSKGINVRTLSETFKALREQLPSLSSSLIHEHNFTLNDRNKLSTVIKGIAKNSKLEELIIESLALIKKIKLDNIQICKVGTGTLEDSYVMEGLVFNRKPEGKVGVKKGRTAIYNCPIDISRTETKGTVLLRNAEDLLNFSKNEEDEVKTLVDEISKADIVICNGKVDPSHLDFFDKNNILVFKLLSKHDVKRMRDLCGGSISPVLTGLRVDNMGEAQVEQFSEGGINYTRFKSEGMTKGNTKDGVITIVLKDSLSANLEEYERIIHKTLTVLRHATDFEEGKKVNLVEGNGIFENKVADIILNLAMEHENYKQHIVKSVSEALRKFTKKGNDEIFDIYENKIKGMQYAIDLVCVALETEDYLLVKGDDMKITPRTNKHWDD